MTFPVTKEKGAWESGTEQASYSVWVAINQQTDEITVDRTTDSSRWKLAGKKPAFDGFSDANRKALEFAKCFYSAAFLGVR